MKKYTIEEVKANNIWVETITVEQKKILIIAFGRTANVETISEGLCYYQCNDNYKSVRHIASQNSKPSDYISFKDIVFPPDVVRQQIPADFTLKYTIEELKEHKIWVKCSGIDAKKLCMAFNQKSKATGSYDFYKYDPTSKNGICRGTCYIQNGEGYILFDAVVFPEEEKKLIVGYRAPFDMFCGEVKKGAAFCKINDFDLYSTHGSVKHPMGDVCFGLPKEIVETWEPIYGMKYPEGTLLYTRDGRITDNARVVGHQGFYNIVKTNQGYESKKTDCQVGMEYYNTINEEELPEL